MTDHNRGAYTPQSEAPLAFDARRTRGGERPLPLTLIISAVILVVIVIALVVFLMNQPDGSGEAAKDAPTIDAMKTTPEAATPIAEPRQGLQVYTEGQPMPETPAFAPPPEQPGLRPTMPAAAPAPKAPAAKAPPVADPLGALTVSAAPKAAPVPAPKAAPAPLAVPTAKGPALSAAGASVQIGAFSSAALAEQGWNDIAKLLPGQMAGKTKRVETIDREGETFHRAFVGGFSSRAEADAFCAALQGRGRSCLVRN